MNTDIPELWSERDRVAVEVLQRAVADGDLLSALMAIEGAGPAVGLEAATAIARLATRVRAAIGGLVEAGPNERLAVLRAVIADDFGLGGDDADYFAPENSLLSSVLRRHKGQPILVASVWILVGQAAGVDVLGVGFPGHFLALVDGLYVDVFAGGVALGPDALRALGERVMPGRRFDPQWLAIVDMRAMAERVLRNLTHAYQQTNDQFSRYRALRLLAGLRSEDPALQLEVAMLTEAFGAWSECRELYRRILKAFPGTREAQVAELRRLELQQKERLLH